MYICLPVYKCVSIFLGIGTCFSFSICIEDYTKNQAVVVVAIGL